MIPFQRILFPVDYSEACLQTVPFVQDMVRQFSAELILMKAFEYPPIGILDMRPNNEETTPPVVSAVGIQAREEAMLAEFAADHFPGVKGHKILREGDPAEAIRHLVASERVDLVMMPTRGHGAFRRLLLGSITGKVLHDASCALWTDTHAALNEHKPSVPYKSIVCALGLSDESRVILQGAVAIAAVYGAKLHLVHSVETPTASYEVDFGPFRKELIEAAESALQKLRAEAGIEATISVGSGAVAEVVRVEAEKHKADLVVTGRGHAQGTLSSVWSALYGIVRESPCPVLSI